MKRLVARVERGIDLHLPAADARPARLHTAMRYSMQAGGKRLRPVLVLATAELFGITDDRALPAAVALECVHTYSLIHDDLPCMDNDDLRRGRPTAHKAFDEATALLAGDALLTHAFALLAGNYADDSTLARALLAELADAAGSRRLIGGQMEDLLAEKNADATADDLEFIHRNKTAAMIEAAFALGALVGQADEPAIAALRVAGRDIGLVFQIVDDILDATASSGVLGKTAGKDAQAGKTTYVKLHGLATARGIAVERTESAIAALARVAADTRFLTTLTRELIAREK
ncbi:polyprenyl synthetase family protein [Horticoccus luteus]|nr:farnesyl diphosphate synthase [Horticoccus luteus]